MLRIGVPKGVLKEKSLQLIKNAIGINCEENKLSYFDGQYSFYFAKHRDIPRLILDGKIDVGITSTEWLEETSGANKLLVIKELKWCNSRISFIRSENFAPPKERLRCVTEYKRIAERYLSSLFLNYELYVVTGSSEGFVPTLFDCCVDCVETGKTLRENNLVEDDIILESKVIIVTSKHVVSNPSSSKLLENVVQLAEKIV